MAAGEENLGRLFQPDFIDAGDRFNTHYRPVGYLFSFLVYKIFGVAPVYLNILIVLAHLSVIMMVFFILRRLLDDDLWAFGTVLIFAVEGVASDAVFYMGAGQLYFPEIFPHYICLISFVYWIKNKHPLLLALSWAAGLFAFFANEFSWPLIPLMWTISYYYDGQRSWKLPFKPRFYPFYLAILAWAISGYKCIINRPEMMAEGAGMGILSRMVSVKHIKRLLDETDQVFHKVPLVGDVFQSFPPYIIGILVIVVMAALFIYAIIRIKDKRFRFLMLWLVFSALVLIPIPLSARYLYHSSIPFWGAVLFFAAFTLNGLKAKHPNWNIKLIGVIGFLLLFLSHLSINIKRERLWDRVGDFYYERIVRVEPEVSDIAELRMIYFIQPENISDKRIKSETGNMKQQLRVYLDNPYIQYTIISPSEADTMRTGEDDIMFDFDGMFFSVVKTGVNGE